MSDIEHGTPSMTVWTYDWVPPGQPGPRGNVRDLRLCWALEEAGLDYRVQSTPFHDRTAAHFARQPFGQVPFLTDGEVTVFESGACLLYIAGKSELLMPRDPVGAAETLQWVIAALNSIEMATVPWWFLNWSGTAPESLTRWAKRRLDQLGAVLGERAWLAAGRFTVADILMADVLRGDDVRRLAASPAIEAYVERLCARPAFKKAQADQLAHYAAEDARRGDAAS